MRSRWTGVTSTLAFATMALLAVDAGAQGLSDPEKAKAINKCHIVIERTGQNVAVDQLNALEQCADAVFKCVQTKPGDADCLDNAHETCTEQIQIANDEQAQLVDAVVRKCGDDLTVDDLLDPTGLDFESLKDECKKDFGVDVIDLDSVGVCLALQHACELERMFAIEAPRAAGLLAVAGVDPALRAELACLTPYGGTDGNVGDPRGAGRLVNKCAQAAKTAGAKLVDAGLKALGRCLDTTFTCVQVKTDPTAFSACIQRAQDRCDDEFANLDAASARPGPALRKACGSLDFAVLRPATGLLIDALAADCKHFTGSEPTTLAAYADCLVRSHRCGVAELARFNSPRAEELLTQVGRSLTDVCTAPTPTPTATVTPTPTVTTTPTPTFTVPAPVATPTGGGPVPTATVTVTTTPVPTVTPTQTLTPTPTPTATPCDDSFEPNSFPNAGASLNAKCGPGGCTDEGYDIQITANIATPTDDDFYVWDVQHVVGQTFQIVAQLGDLADGVDYDLYLYRKNGDVFEQVDASNNHLNSNETVRYDGIDGDNSGQYAVEVRPITGSSCVKYKLRIQDPS